MDSAVVTRFMSNVDVRGLNECWSWIGYKRPDGYGEFNSGNQSRRAHRHSWIIFRGPIPKGILVLHRCNNKTCVNPKHLYLGNECDNARDYLLANPPLRLCEKVAEARRKKRYGR